MISRHRLVGRGRFAAVRANGTRASAGAVRVSVAGNGLDVARVGFAVVGVRSAVLRNRVRRRLREAVRPQLGRLAGHDAVLSAGAEAARLPFGILGTYLVTAVDSALARAKGTGDGSTARAKGTGNGSTADNASMTAPPGVS